jgi:branched-chain amino acid transport system ATP-binding protein
MRPGPSPDPDGLLEVQGVTVRFGGLTALDNVSFTAPGRQVTGIIGPNGAGKTTLLNVLCGFVRPDQGRLSFGRTELGRLRPHQLARLGITRTLQGVGLFRHLSVLENVMVGAQGQARAGFWSALGGLPVSDRDEHRLRAQARDALDRVGVADLAEAMPDQLAYGLRKRVALARALASRPRLLLLDEPAGGLNHDEVGDLVGLFRKIHADYGLTMLIVEHHMNLVMRVCDHVVCLDFGKKIADGGPKEVQANQRVIDAYLGADDGAA